MKNKKENRISAYFKKQFKFFKKDFCKKEEKESFKEGLTYSDFFSIFKKYLVVILFFFLFTFIPFSILSSRSYEKTFYATGQLSFNQYVHGDLYTTIQEDITTDTFAQNVLEQIKITNILHKDGSEISINEISKGISSTTKSDSNNLFVTFTNADGSIVVDVCNIVLKQAFEYYQDGKDGLHINRYLFIGSEALILHEGPNQLMYYLLLSFLGSFTITFSAILILIKIKGTIWCVADIPIKNFTYLSYRKKNISNSSFINDVFRNKENLKITLVAVGNSSIKSISNLLNNTSKYANSFNEAKSINQDYSLNINQGESVIVIVEQSKAIKKDFNKHTKKEIQNNNQNVCFIFLK